MRLKSFMKKSVHIAILCIVNLVFFALLTIWQITEMSNPNRYQGVGMCTILLVYLYTSLYGIFAYLGTKQLFYPSLILFLFACVFFFITGIFSGFISETSFFRYIITVAIGAGTLLGLSLACSCFIKFVQRKNNKDLEHF